MSETVEVEACLAGPDCELCGTPDAVAVLSFDRSDPMERIAAYAELTERKRILRQKLDDVQAAMDDLEPALLDWYAENGTQSIKANGATVYLHRQIWARPAENDWPKAVAALKASGLADLVQERANINTLSAWVREREAAGEPLPAAFEGAISVAEEFGLRVRRS